MADRARRWMLTFNNPIPNGWNHESIKLGISNYNSVVYWCMSDEIGNETEHFHTHLYIVFENAISYKSLNNVFRGVHRDVVNGTSTECRNYVFKEGKWLADAKADTNIRESHEEYGELPNERPGKRTDIDMLYDMIKNGMSNYEIIEENPKYMLHIEKIDKARKVYLEEQYKNTWRNLDVTYIWGATGTGKTRGVKETYGYANVYTVTDYLHPFDGYAGQDVILFEEFRSSIRVADMLQYLDGYPIELPCRYNNKIACFTKVFICTNIDLREQYRDVKIDYPETWNAFIRRIHRVKIYIDANTQIIMETQSYLRGMCGLFDNPFLPDDETFGDTISSEVNCVQMTLDDIKKNGDKNYE